MSVPNSFVPSVPVLETPRLRLRGYRVDDFAPSVAMWQDPAYYRYLSAVPLSSEEIWKVLLRNAGHWALMGYGPWAVEEKATGQYIGMIGMFNFRRDLEPPLGDAPEFGWVLAPGAHGQGYATEGVTAALAWARNHFGPVRMVCLVHPENVPSLRIAAKFGFHEYARTVYKGEPGVLLERVAQG